MPLDSFEIHIKNAVIHGNYHLKNYKGDITKNIFIENRYIAITMKIDEMNKKILHFLQKDARITYKEIANKLKRSETTIRDRIRAMEETGVIQGYIALVDKTVLGLNFFAMILANPILLSDLDEVTERIKKVKNVLRVYQISGEHKIAFFMVAPSYKDLKEVLRSCVLPLGLKDEKIIAVLEADREFLSPIEVP